jgi:hypothetical protein
MIKIIVKTRVAYLIHDQPSQSYSRSEMACTQQGHTMLLQGCTDFYDKEMFFAQHFDMQPSALPLYIYMLRLPQGLEMAISSSVLHACGWMLVFQSNP